MRKIDLKRAELGVVAVTFRIMILSDSHRQPAGGQLMMASYLHPHPLQRPGPPKLQTGQIYYKYHFLGDS